MRSDKIKIMAYYDAGHPAIVIAAVWSRFLLGNINDGLIDCHSLQATKYKQAKHW